MWLIGECDGINVGRSPQQTKLFLFIIIMNSAHARRFRRWRMRRKLSIFEGTTMEVGA
jgi:hypothetical protein